MKTNDMKLAKLANNSSIKTVLVTGAAGLIGSAVVRLLISLNIKVVACDNFSIGTWHGENPLLIWENQDINSALLYENLNAYDIDTAVHCSAHPGGKSLAEPVENVRVNALGSMQLFDWCARTGTPVVYLSSSAVYGTHHGGLISEEVPSNPGTVYAASKVACENFLRILGEGYGLEWAVLRLFATYGAGHQPSSFQGIVNIMLTQLLSGNRVVVRGSVKRERDLIYVDDAAAAVVKSIFIPGAHGHIINIGTGIPVTIYQLIEALSDTLSRKMNTIEIVEESGTIGDPFSNVADCKKARHILDFTPQYDLERGLKELINARNTNDRR